MGGKSSSKQETKNTSSNTNIVNDGEYAGAGSVVIDESDHSIEDAFNTDNSVSVEDSYNTDNSIENDGDYAGNNGTINITDGGAVKDAFAFGNNALDEVGDVVTKAFDSSKEQNKKFSDNLQLMLEKGQRSQENIITSTAKSNSEDRELITKLAQSTALAGQDIVAQSSQRMTLYMSLALAIGFVAIVFSRGRK